MAIFLNYRRSDSAPITGRIDDHLRAAFGDAEVYRDIDSIPLGEDYVEHIEGALQSCDICLAIIGPAWKPEDLDRTEDFVRLELEIVLARKIPVIPVLVDGARLPDRDRLPNSLRPLLRRQAALLDSGSDFRAQIKRIVEHIEERRKRVQSDALRASAPTEPETPQQPSTPSLEPAVMEQETPGPEALPSLKGLIEPTFSMRRHGLLVVPLVALAGGITWYAFTERSAAPNPTPVPSSTPAAASPATLVPVPPDPQLALPATSAEHAEPTPPKQEGASRKVPAVPTVSLASAPGALPSATANVGGAEVAGGEVTDDARVVASLRPGFRGCYQRGLVEAPGTTGSIRLSIYVGPDGKVRDTKATSSGTLPDAVTECVRVVAGQATFAPPEEGSATIIVPVTFVKN